MIKRLLIANRGEIAFRIIRACREHVKTNIPYHLEMLSHADFLRSEYFTDFIAKYFKVMTCICLNIYSK